ncbi:MAG: FAD-binding oxidoreductase [Ktedonobacteraceae bacterium]|nr:FAD-binding oxidoreductase [Ktedonobacteraceae bacterium]
MEYTSRRDHEGRMDTEMIAEREGRRSYWQALQELALKMSGRLLLPGDPDFEAERHVWNGTVDRHPALITCCMDVDDVIASVVFARQQDLSVSVRSGGHSPAGYGTNDGGIVIDLSSMNAISIDPEQRTARIESGLTWGEVAGALHPYGLALTSGDVATVGVGGLILGGGIGWQVRKYGLTLDRLRAVELVTANGETLRASASENAELFWGLRGGGGNFGIATAFEVDLHPAGIVLGGAVFYDIADAENILQAYTRYAMSAPDELTTMAVFASAPAAPFIPVDKQGKPVLLIVVCYTGNLAEGEQVVGPLRHLATPIATMLAPMPYPALFALTEAGAVRGLRHHARSSFLQTLNDSMLHVMVEEVRATMSSTMLVQLRMLGGAMSRVNSDTTAFAHRNKPALVFITNFGPDSIDDVSRTDRVWQALQPYADGVYVNFLADEGQQRIHEAYPSATYDRLVALKNRYDPTNLFHLNQNILPTL